MRSCGDRYCRWGSTANALGLSGVDHADAWAAAILAVGAAHVF